MHAIIVTMPLYSSVTSRVTMSTLTTIDVYTHITNDIFMAHHLQIKKTYLLTTHITQCSQNYKKCIKFLEPIKTHQKNVLKFHIAKRF
jgi:hypothetical protein